MSRRAADWAWTTTAKGVELLVLLALADYANEKTLECHPSLPNLAEKTGLGTSTVRRSLRALEDAGIVRADVSSGGRHMRSRYHLAVTVTQPERAGNGSPQSETEDVATQPERPGSVPETQPERRNTQPERAGNPTRAVAVVPKTGHRTGYEPTTARELAVDHKPMALVSVNDSPPSLADVRNAQTLVQELTGIQPRRISAQLTETVADAIHRGIAGPVIRQAVTEWSGSQYAAGALPGFISRVDRGARPGVVRSTTNARVEQALALADTYPEGPA